MMPLEHHIDGGLGAIGEAFEEAAKTLAANAREIDTSHPHLPISFLYRHAIELYLKSVIVVIHRTLQVPYGPNPHEGPAFLPVEGKWKPLHRVHSVGTLWTRFVELVAIHAEELGERWQTNWQAIPDELPGMIKVIEKADASSTFFRYPDGRDLVAEAAKSSWKQADPEALLAQLQQPGAKPVKSLMLLQPDGETITAMFQHDSAPLAELTRILAAVADQLSNAHIGLRVELADGY